jgi:hypothetical protein
MRLTTLLAVLALFLAAPAVSRAQSLGDVAKKEQEKQEKKKKKEKEKEKEKSGKPPAPVKTYTDEDLKKARESESGAVTVLPENGNLEAGSASSGDDEAVSGEEGRPAGGRKRTETYWRERATRARSAVEEADAKVKDLEGRIAALRNDMNPVNTQDPNRLQSRDRELQQAIDALDGARLSADAARKALADLEEEARRAGALPGWLR